VIGVAEETFLVTCVRGDHEKLVMMNDAGQHMTVCKVARVHDFAPDSRGCALVFAKDVVGFKYLRLFNFNQSNDRQLLSGARLDCWVRL